MGVFSIYAGLGGGFGGAKYCGKEKFDTEEEAYEAAYRMAIEEYNSYSGLYGLPDAQAIMDDPEYYGIYDFNSLTEKEKEDAINDILNEDCENWIEYYVEESFENEDEDEEWD